MVGGGPAGATVQARSWAPTPRCVKPSRSGAEPEQRTGAGPTLPRLSASETGRHPAGFPPAWSYLGPLE